MNYWAFISYAHEDERWAAWLQRALESYQLPRALAPLDENTGKKARRLVPVFRDREDFASSSNLGKQVEAALESSRALIVVCSPAAARSRWVNQEIERFRELHGGRQIHCMIVDGDPESADPNQSCFPPALLADSDREPLAADARKNADGKKLARLKIIAGILGVQLDALRHRDQQRRMRWMAGGLGAAFAIAVAMGVMAFLAVQARDEAEQARAETQANYDFLLGDLQSKLVEVGRLDILEDVGEFISQRGQQQGLDELSESQQMQVALAWRQVGTVHHQRSEYEQAMDVFQRSLQIYEAIQARYPENLDYLFELSQAEFWVGYIHYERGEYAVALDNFNRYLDFSEQLFAAEPANTTYIMEMAFAHANLFDVHARMVGSDPQKLVDHAREGVRYNELALELEPENESFLSMLSETTADLADSLMRVCQLKDAHAARLQVLAISRELLERNPRNTEYREDVGNALSGLGHIEASTGEAERALAHYDESTRIFENLLAQEPTNAKYQWYHVWKKSYSAELLSDLGQLDLALQQFEDTRQIASRLLSEQKEVSIEDRIVYGRFLTINAELAHRRGDQAMARDLMEEGLDLLSREAFDNPNSFTARRQLAMALVRAQLIGHEPAPGAVRELALNLVDQQPEAMACYDAELAVKQSVLAGHPEAAAGFMRFLKARGFRAPGLIRFCREQGGCGDVSL